jgi:MYXO-CTERM domain-containing protein
MAAEYASDLQGSCGCRVTPARTSHGAAIGVGLLLLTLRRRRR